MNSSRLLLLSGGIDSAALLNLYKKENTPVNCIHFSYGQKSEKAELLAANQIVDHYDMRLEHIRLQFPLTYKGEEILCRNILFVIMLSVLASLGKECNGTLL